MTHLRSLAGPIAALSLATFLVSAHGAAAEDTYPVSGRWTYKNVGDKGPSQDCKDPTMDFRGAQRLDKGGGVPQYRNVSVTKNSPTDYQVVDEFFTVQIRGRVTYGLRIVDDDHLQIDTSGKTITLRRCQ
jgi:hypothetical protein